MVLWVTFGVIKIKIELSVQWCIKQQFSKSHVHMRTNEKIMHGIKWLLGNEQHQHSKIAKYEIVFFTIYRQWNYNGMQKCDDECDSIWFLLSWYIENQYIV